MDEHETPVETSEHAPAPAPAQPSAPVAASAPAEPAPAEPAKRTAEEWFARKGTEKEKHLFAGARASWKWVVGWELTEAEYDAAMKAAGEVEAR